jgi:hypothetical protein
MEEDADPEKGGLAGTLTLSVLVDRFPWSSLRVVFIVGSSSDPSAQGQPAQVNPDVWNTEIWDGF